MASTDVTLTLATRPVSAVVVQGERFGVTLSGTWANMGSNAVYLQASDDSGHFVAPAASLAPKRSAYQIAVALPTSTAPGTYSGTLSVRACADSLCTQPYQGAIQSISYTVKVNALEEWGTLQRTSRHDGYVPVQIDPTRYKVAWTYQGQTAGALSGVVTDGNNVYFSAAEYGSPSVYATRASDGAPQWRRVFTNKYGTAAALSPPSVADGVVYAAMTAADDTWLYALRASDGLQSYRSQFYTQWGHILNPTLRNGKAYVNAGGYTGEVYAFNIADGSAAWTSHGGTYGMNTPAVDDDFVYAYNGESLNVYSPDSGAILTTIGSSPDGTYDDYYGTPMLGSADHVMVFSGSGMYGRDSARQLLDYSVAGGAVRWMSLSLYGNYPATAKGVVYAASNESYKLDALDEATGRVLWSWKPPEDNPSYVGNVVVTDNMVFVSTWIRLYAIDIRRHRTAWSVPTPGTVSISANRMLFVVEPYNTYDAWAPHITAYRLN